MRDWTKMSESDTAAFNEGISILDAHFEPTPGGQHWGETKLTDRARARLTELGWTVDGTHVRGYGLQFPLLWERNA